MRNFPFRPLKISNGIDFFDIDVLFCFRVIPSEQKYPVSSPDLDDQSQTQDNYTIFTSSQSNNYEGYKNNHVLDKQVQVNTIGPARRGDSFTDMFKGSYDSDSTDSQSCNVKDCDARLPKECMQENAEDNWSMRNLFEEEPKAERRGRIIQKPITVSRKMLKAKSLSQEQHLQTDMPDNTSQGNLGSLNKQCTNVRLSRSHSEPGLTDEKQAAVVDNEAFDEVDAGLKRVKSDLINYTEHINNEDEEVKQTVKKKKKSLMASVKRRVSFRKKKARQTGSSQNPNETGISETIGAKNMSTTSDIKFLKHTSV